MHRVAYIKNFGWTLEIDDLKKISKCVNSFCIKNISIPFMFCRECEQAICRECELGSGNRYCRSRDNEHEHFNIVKVIHNPEIN